MSTGQTGILLVEDHAVVRAGFRRLIEARPDLSVVAEASTGEAAGQLYATHRPAVTVMDLSLPGMSGLEAMRRILARDTRARILIFSMHRSPVLVQRALEAGARGYVSKDCPSGILVEAIERVARGKLYLDPSISQDVALEQLSGRQSPLATLTPREFEIFRFVAEGKSCAQIAEQLHLSEKTIANNITRIKGRLGLATTTEMVLLAVRSGLIHP